MPFFEILHVNALIFFTLLMILHYSLTIFNINANALSLIFFINANTLVDYKHSAGILFHLNSLKTYGSRFEQTIVEFKIARR